MIANALSLTKGAGGPSHFDSDQFCHMLLIKKFKTETIIVETNSEKEGKSYLLPVQSGGLAILLFSEKKHVN